MVAVVMVGEAVDGVAVAVAAAAEGGADGRATDNIERDTGRSVAVGSSSPQIRRKAKHESQIPNIKSSKRS